MIPDVLKLFSHWKKNKCALLALHAECDFSGHKEIPCQLSYTDLAKTDSYWNKQGDVCVEEMARKQLLTGTNSMWLQSVSRGRNVKWGLLLSLYPGLLQWKLFCQHKSCQSPSKQARKRVHLTRKSQLQFWSFDGISDLSVSTAVRENSSLRKEK